MGLIFGQNSRRVVTKGSLMASYQYVDEEECCVIARARHTGPNRPVVVIRLSDFYKYVDDRFLFEASKEMANILGFGVSLFACSEIARFINDRLSELLTMKPMPDDMRAKDPIEVEDLRVDGNRIQLVGTVH